MIESPETLSPSPSSSEAFFVLWVLIANEYNSCNRGLFSHGFAMYVPSSFAFLTASNFSSLFFTRSALALFRDFWCNVRPI